MKVYIASKMRGLPNNGFDGFDQAEISLRDQYPHAEIINPAALDRDHGFDGGHNADAAFMRGAMARDCAAICTCTHIALFGDWLDSTFAPVELALGVGLGLHVLTERDFIWQEAGIESIALYHPISEWRDVPETILEEAQRITSGDRDKQYGHPRAHWSRTAAAINAMFGTDFKPEDWGTCMILDKLARERNGHKRDNLVDAAGYARCIERCLEVGDA